MNPLKYCYIDTSEDVLFQSVLLKITELLNMSAVYRNVLERPEDRTPKTEITSILIMDYIIWLKF